MANEVATTEAGWLLSPSGKTIGEILPTGTGYVLARGQTYDEWAADGNKIITLDNALHWVLGDWLNAGENKFGQDSSQADAFSNYRDADWWQQVRRVAFQVRPQNRRPELPWTYHQAVASLDDMEQRELLQEAIDRKWNLRDLKAQVALVKNGHTPLENESSAYKGAKGGDVAPARKLADVAKEAQDAKKAAAILKRQERLDLQERKRAENAERKAAMARGERLPPRPKAVVPEAEPVLYDVLLADPWRDEGMTLTEAIALPVKDLIANNALMFMWSTVEKLSESLVLLETWGFDRRSQLVWRKTKATVTPYTREQHELVLIGTRGKPALPAERPMSVFDAAAQQGGHPDAILIQIIEKMLLPGRKRVVVLPSGAVPLAYRDHWAVWDAQPKGDQKAA